VENLRAPWRSWTAIVTRRRNAVGANPAPNALNHINSTFAAVNVHLSALLAALSPSILRHTRSAIIDRANAA
jgi:hypothetical protein